MSEGANIPDVEWRTDRVAKDTASAAKLHVLALDPLKKKLGTKWPRVSGLVHKLVETAIVRVQGPADFHIRLDELSYAVVFRNLSFEDTNRVCGLIARDVCQALFGDQIDEVSVRSVIAAIHLPPDADSAHYGKSIEAILERNGTESVVTQSTQSNPSVPVATVSANILKPTPSAVDRIKAAHSKIAEIGLKVGLFPVWELQRGSSNSLLLTPFRRRGEQLTTTGAQSLGIQDQKRIGEVEIALLNAAVAYATRASDAQKICAVGVGVGYETLSGFHSRIRYITALQKTHFLPSNPLFLKIEQIPEGTPAVRLVELAAMLNLPNIRVLLEFQSLRALPKFEIRLRAHGLGGAIPKHLDHEHADRFIKAIAELAASQKAFVFLDRLDTPELVQVACQHNVRFGTGAALGMQHFSGLEEIPEFPLMRGNSG
jgi:hypothetical protein